MDLAKHNKTIKHLKNVIEKMNEVRWTNIDIMKENMLIDEIARRFSISKEGERFWKREIFKLLIIENAESWYSKESNEKIFHTYSDCPKGKSIEPENIRVGRPKGYDIKKPAELWLL